MRTLKPLRLGLLARPYQYLGRHQLGVTVLALATMEQAPRLLQEAEIWKLSGSELDEDEALDLGIPKPCAEFLATGKAYAHDRKDPGRCAVQVAVAGKEKNLLVTGHRAWIQGRLTDPLPVDGVPVNWRHAYGGPGYAENPVGLGAAPGEDGLVRAPQVESFDDLMTYERKACRPASFGPVSPIRPRRFALSGEYDPKWVQRGFPGFPDTLDPHFFNAASPDQWLADAPELPAGAAYRIGNMHPRHAVLQGELPRWRARCFVRRYGSDALEEVALRHTTVWFFPDRERMLLMFQGAAPVRADDASDLSLIMPALEIQDAPRDLAHYRHVVDLRLAEDDGAVYALRDSDLVPRGLMLDEIEPSDGPLSGPLATNMKQRGRNLKADMLDRAREVGQDPAQYAFLDEDAVPPLQSLDDLPDHLRRLRRQTREIKARALRQKRDAEARLKEELKDMPPDSPLCAGNLIHAVSAPPPGGPPLFSRGEMAATMIDQARQAQLHDTQGMSADRAQAMMDDAQQRLLEVYRQSAHHQNAPATVPPLRAARMRRRVESLLQGSRDLSGLDLTGADLSGLDLSGARCRGTLMEEADLTGASLAGADLQDAVLTRAYLFDTRCDGADFTRANLGRMEAFGSCFSKARLDGAILDAAVFEQCDFEDMRIEQCAPAGVRFVRCRFAGSRWHAVTLWQEALLMDCSHERASLSRVVWLECTLQGMDYSQATLTACAWVQCAFDTPPVFTHADLVTCGFVQSSLDGARFDHARLSECNLRDLSLDRADFSGAQLQNCDLSESRLRDAEFTGADARGSLFMETDLTGASLRRADLIDTLMQKSDFRHADLSDANLFRADISQGRLDSSTRTDGAYIKQAKTLPAAAAGARQ